MKNKSSQEKITGNAEFIGSWEHGQEGTHFACKEMVDKLGGEVGCCYCNKHSCVASQEKKCTCEEIGVNVKYVLGCPIHGLDKKHGIPKCPHNYKGLWCPDCTTLPPSVSEQKECQRECHCHNGFPECKGYSYHCPHCSISKEGDWEKRLDEIFEMLPSEERFIEQEAEDGGYEKVEAKIALQELIQSSLQEERERTVRKIQEGLKPFLDDLSASAETLIKHGLTESGREMQEGIGYVYGMLTILLKK